jgi:hypothetical protein
MPDGDEHMNKPKHQKLSDVFPEMLRYYFEKIGDSVYGSKPPEFGAVHVPLINQVVQDFGSALDEKVDLEIRDGLVQVLEELMYALEALQQYLDNPNTSKLNKKDAKIFLFFIREQVKELQDVAREVDEESQS